jgi:5-methylcytosine-specific restriction endonuclease McrA
MRFPKLSRLRLPPDQYHQLQKKVLERDGWRCQSCGSRSNLQIHHQQHRSQLGSDTEQNLITLCARCHTQTHRPAFHNQV